MEVNVNESKCLPLASIKDHDVGGKAKGLSQLMRMGLNVPPGFVIMGAQKDALPADLSDYYSDLEARRVAVRSSATSEDSGETSYAGQYDTLLNVEGISELESAIGQCVDSLHSNRAESYQKQYHHDESNHESMAVVVQKMVDAKY